MRGLFCDKGRVVVRWSAVGDTGDERLYYRIKEKERRTHWRESSAAEAGSRGPVAGEELGVWKGQKTDEKE